MVVPSRLEVVCDAYVKVGVGILGGGFLDEVSLVALPIEGTVFLPRGLAVAFFSVVVFFFFSFPSVLFVVSLYYSFYVGSAVVCDFEGVSVLKLGTTCGVWGSAC